MTYKLSLSSVSGVHCIMPPVQVVHTVCGWTFGKQTTRGRKKQKSGTRFTTLAYRAISIS